MKDHVYWLFEIQLRAVDIFEIHILNTIFSCQHLGMLDD